MQKTIKTIILSVILGSFLCVSGQTQSTSKKPAATPPGVPAAAEKVGEDLWKWKDPQGKTWIYRRTMFGYARTADVQEKTSETETTATQEGPRVVGEKAGEVTFERVTPFGKARWTRAMAEMTVDEKAAYAAYERTPKSSKPAPSAK